MTQSELDTDREVIAAALASTDKCPECSAVAHKAAEYDCLMTGGSGTVGIWADAYAAAVQKHSCGRTIDVVEAAGRARIQRDIRARTRWPAALDEIERLQRRLDDALAALHHIARTCIEDPDTAQFASRAAYGSAKAPKEDYEV